ncbi:hypothetical protein [Nocardia wallacei]|uniref:hypothetical protein n=1 Tax=Nocardia wallacei TaxID=480035 RepID=UPI00245396F8|nr:hypothetical protein [Nocardia wallacei]
MDPSISVELIAQLRAARDQAADARNLPRALELDNELEYLAQRVYSPRQTCARCGSWADHVHEPATGDRMLADGDPPVDDEDIATAVQVFALAATALPHHWVERDSGADIAVELGPYRYVVTVCTGDSAMRPRAFIADCVRRGTGEGRVFPVIHATARTTAAIIAAYRHAHHIGLDPAPTAVSGPVPADDPDDLLARFRARQNEIDAEIDAHDGNRDAGHLDRLAGLHRDASELMAALDNQLSLGGPLPRAWARAATA